MKAIFLLLAGTLAACQSWPSHPPDWKPPPPHRGAGTGAGSSSAGAASASGAGEKAGVGSWYGMCALNQRIMSARTPDERQFIIEQVMPNMSAEERDQHLRMMQQSCQ
jgi:hypothetical protein